MCRRFRLPRPTQLRRAWPTAFVHFLTVELAPAFIAILSWVNLTRQFQLERRLEDVYERVDAVLACVRSQINAVFYSVSLRYQSVEACLGAEFRVASDLQNGTWTSDLENRTLVRDLGWQDVDPSMWIIRTILWLPIAVLCALICYCVVALFVNGSTNAGSGAYANFCWRIERQRPYKVLALSVFHFVVCICVAMLFASGLRYFALLRQHGAAKFFELFSRTAVDIGALFLSVHSLSHPAILPHSWADNADFGRVIFRREWSQTVSFSCDYFGLQLTDALWRARCGDFEHLRAMLEEPDQAEVVLEICTTLQRIEDMEEITADPEAQINHSRKYASAPSQPSPDIADVEAPRGDGCDGGTSAARPSGTESTLAQPLASRSSETDAI